MQSSLEQARFELDGLIRKLLRLEPYWKKCSNCKNEGKCCIGANILVFNVEWDEIKAFIKSIPESDKEKIKKPAFFAETKNVSSIACGLLIVDGCHMLHTWVTAR